MVGIPHAKNPGLIARHRESACQIREDVPAAIQRVRGAWTSDCPEAPGGWVTQRELPLAAGNELLVIDKFEPFVAGRFVTIS